MIGKREEFGPQALVELFRQDHGIRVAESIGPSHTAGEEGIAGEDEPGLRSPGRVDYDE